MGRREGRDRILTLQSELNDEGFHASIRKICSVLGYARPNIYYPPKATAGRNVPLDRELVGKVREVIMTNPEYGTRRITAILRRQLGIPLNRKRIHRIIVANCWQRWKRPYGWCHLVAVIDCCDRCIVGWRFSKSGRQVHRPVLSRTG